MGLGGISIWQLLIILVIVILIFGTKRMKSLGGDLGGAIKSFRKAMDTSDGEPSSDDGDEQKKIESEDSEPDAQFTEQQDRERHG